MIPGSYSNGLNRFFVSEYSRTLDSVDCNGGGDEVSIASSSANTPGLLTYGTSVITIVRSLNRFFVSEYSRTETIMQMLAGSRSLNRFFVSEYSRTKFHADCGATFKTSQSLLRQRILSDMISDVAYSKPVQGLNRFFVSEYSRTVPEDQGEDAGDRVSIASSSANTLGR